MGTYESLVRAELWDYMNLVRESCLEDVKNGKYPRALKAIEKSNDPVAKKVQRFLKNIRTMILFIKSMPIEDRLQLVRIMSQSQSIQE